MGKSIFISCGQFTEAEKRLGKQIAQMVKALTSLEPFFAEDVQDLNGLDANILRALHEAIAFIVVLHPRGEITRPDGSKLVRGSVWIEQEIAIATYIQRHENRQLPIVAFKHKSVGLEGMRSLLHLNPIEFSGESEVLAALPKRLREWNSLKPSGIELMLASRVNRQQDGHTIRRLEVTLENNTNQRIAEYDFEVRIPSALLKHFSDQYLSEVRSDNPHFRHFRFNQSNAGSVNPRDRLRLTAFDYCTACAAEVVGALVAEAVVSATAWIYGNEHSVEKTIKQLAAERNDAH